MSKKSRRVARTRRALLAVSLVLVTMMVAVGGTVAWLTASTPSVTNTFTTSDIVITLAETTKDFKMVPGHTIAKDPKVTVEAGSEKCYLFVKVEKSANFDTFMTYTPAEGWTELTDVDDVVYYRVVEASTDDQQFGFLQDDQVTVKTDVTKDQMDALNEETMPTLTFTAYASQFYKSANQEFEVKDAWANISNPSSGTVTP